MKPVAHIETSVVSYLTARTPRNTVAAAYREITRTWWRSAADRFDLVASALVVSEAGAGDPIAARSRLSGLETVAILDATAESEALAGRLLEAGAVPRRAGDDAAHIAIAAANSVDYLVTWNFRHIANAAMRSRIEGVCRQAGYAPPVICTPGELREDSDEDN